MLYLSLGTNLGNRSANLQQAIELIDHRIGKVMLCATPIETTPVGFTSENKFLNTAIAVETTLSVKDILATTQTIEQEMGRTQKSINGIYHDRIIDIDLLFYNDLIISSAPLTLPHPHLHERLFVLEPLAEIAPTLLHPLYNKTIEEIFNIRKRCYISPLSKDLCTLSIVDNFNGLLSQLSAHPTPLNLQQLTARSKEYNPNTTIYLVFDTLNDQLIGTATLSICHLLTGSKAWIEDVVIDNAYRSKGFARILINHLLFEARRAKTNSVNLTSRPTRLAANRLYQTMGFQKRETNVYKYKE